LDINEYGCVSLSEIYRVLVRFQTNLLINFMNLNPWAKSCMFGKDFNVLHLPNICQLSLFFSFCPYIFYRRGGNFASCNDMFLTKWPIGFTHFPYIPYQCIFNNILVICPPQIIKFYIYYHKTISCPHFCLASMLTLLMF
jgi:hypothetical protein